MTPSTVSRGQVSEVVFLHGWGLQAAAIEATREGLARDFTITRSTFPTQQVPGEPGAARATRRLREELIEQPPRTKGLADAVDILVEADFRAELGTTGCRHC